MPLEFPIAVNQPEVAEQLIRALDLKGDQPGLLDGYFQVGVQSLDLTDMVQYGFLRRTSRYVSTGSPPTAAATFSGVYFRQQVTGVSNGIIAVVRRVRLFNFNGTAQNFNVGFSAGIAAPGASVFPNPLDSRQLVRPGGVWESAFKQFIANPAASVAVAPTIVGVPAGGSVELAGFVVTDQGGYLNPPAFYVEAAGANVGFHLTVEWEERPVLASELRTAS